MARRITAGLPTVWRPLHSHDGTGLEQQPELGHLFALEALGQGCGRMHLDNSLVARQPLDEIDQRDIVDHRVGVGHHDDRGDPALGRSPACRGDGFAVLGAWFADMHAGIDQARHGDQSATVFDFAA
jgi:hypothetical protein